jgi:hypothetical protein
MREAASAMRSRVPWEIWGLFRRACETVFLETPQALAKSCMETVFTINHITVM